MSHIGAVMERYVYLKTADREMVMTQYKDGRKIVLIKKTSKNEKMKMAGFSSGGNSRRK